MISRELEKFGLTRLASQQEHCSHRTCFEKPCTGSQFCISRLSLAANDRKAVANCIIGRFKNTFDQALQHPWFYSPSFQKVLDVRDKIADGKLPGARLLCLDFEFCALTKTVFEVGVLEYCSGKNIIDAAVQGNIKTLSEIPISTIKDGISKRFKQEMSWKTIRRDYGGYTQAITVGPMSTLRRHSYENPQSPRDHSSCYADILPPDENCVLVIMERSSMTSSYDLLRWLLRRHVDGSRGAAAPEPEWHQLREAPSTSSLSLNVALLRVGPS
ncbi:hypothetical protein VCV18_004391 [Metarhizium anisopliae]